MSLELLLKCIHSDFKSLSLVWFDMLSIFYLLFTNIDRSDVLMNENNKGIQVCVW